MIPKSVSKIRKKFKKGSPDLLDVFAVFVALEVIYEETDFTRSSCRRHPKKAARFEAGSGNLNAKIFVLCYWRPGPGFDSGDDGSSDDGSNSSNDNVVTVEDDSNIGDPPSSETKMEKPINGTSLLYVRQPYIP